MIQIISGIINKWWFKPATFWQFWLPQSGIIGGIAGGLFFWFIFYCSIKSFNTGL